MGPSTTRSRALRFRSACATDTLPIVELLNATFRTPLDPATWLWYTRGNPLGPSRVYVGMDSLDEISGVIAFAPLDLRLSGTAIRGVYAHHLAVRPTFRDTASYLELCGNALDAEAARGVQLVIGPPNKRAYPIHRVLGRWCDFGYLDCLRKLPAFARQHDCEELDCFPADFDDFYRGVARNLHFCVEKDAEWVNWRYQSRPGHPYTVYAAREHGAFAGYVVLKRWQDPDGYRKAHILDLHARTPDILHRLLGAAEFFAGGCNELNLWAVCGYSYRAALEANGFTLSHRQPLIAKMLNGFTASFPAGPCSLMYGDGDTQY